MVVSLPYGPVSSVHSTFRRSDLSHSPYVFFYEVTRACDLVCQHCRADAQRQSHPNELDPAAGKRLIRQLNAFPKPPILVLTGGDPMKRRDIFELVEFAAHNGVRTAMTPSATPLMTRQAVRRLKDVGLERIAVSLDGADPATHDALRQVAGSYDRTRQIMADARDAGFPLQVNTTVTRRNLDQIDLMANQLAEEHITLWSLFFLVPVGRAHQAQSITAAEYEQVFARLWRHALQHPYGIKTTEAHHYRRFVLQRRRERQRDPNTREHGTPRRPPVGISDGNGVMFVSHIGEIFPSGFLPIECGRFPFDSVVDVYQRSALFVALRNPDQFKGKCGRCEYRRICGGSRARAFAYTGDPLESDPDCIYEPHTG
ncbi:MAG: radical SAM/SPASM domain-containing protein [Phycisphaerae bacterium]|nr:radical SAM/SPASM domain-containing protein [Phycisphaerae bacterium]